jgi:hypothetical protein
MFTTFEEKKILFILLTFIVLSGITCDRRDETPETDPLVIELYVKNASFPGMADGSINLEISGGLGPYAIQ